MSEEDKEDYKKRLLALPECDIQTVSPSEAYDRMRFFYEIEVASYLKRCGYNPTPQGKNNASQRSYNEPKKAYKNWLSE